MLNRRLQSLLAIGLIALTWGACTRAQGPTISWSAALPAMGAAAPDFTLRTPEGQTVTLRERWAQKPVLLEFGCLTCPLFRGKVSQMERLRQVVGDRLDYLLVYTTEAHPSDVKSPYSNQVWVTEENRKAGLLLPQPTTFEQRAALAARTQRDLKLSPTVLVDGMDNAAWKAWGARPNSGFLIGADGKILLAQEWLNVVGVWQYLRAHPEVQPVAAPGGAEVRRDVEYGVAGGVSLKLDAYLPPGPGPTPAVLMIHGGGWRSGDKGVFAARTAEFTGRGIACLAINYRLCPQWPYPAAVEDCLAAVRWIRAHAAELRVDPDRLGVMGGSAGGHLSLMVALMEPGPQDLDAQGRPLKNLVLACVSQSGPTALGNALHLGTAEQQKLLTDFLGGTYEQFPERYAEASPLTYVSADDPPVLMVHGTQDMLVPFAQSQRLQGALQQAGVPMTLLPIEGAGHEVAGSWYPQIGEFLAKYLLPAATPAAP